MIFGPNYKEVDIKGYEGLYKISNKGDVISLSKIRGFLKLKERIITPTIKANKYLLKFVLIVYLIIIFAMVFYVILLFLK